MEEQNNFTYNGVPPISHELSDLYRPYCINYGFTDIIQSLDSIPPTFTLIVNGNKYNCHIEILMALSSVIYQEIIQNPGLSEYSLEIDNSHFSLFVDFLNGKVVPITAENRPYFQTISQALGFSPIRDFQVLQELNLKNYTAYLRAIIPNIPRTLTLTNTVTSRPINRLITLSYCKNLNKDIQSIQIKSDDISDICNFLNGYQITITFSNFDNFRSCVSQLDIPYLNSIVKSISHQYDYLYSIVSAINLQETIFSMKDENCQLVYDSIKATEYVQNQTLRNELFHTLELFYSIRPKSHSQILTFLTLFSKDNQSNFHEWLMDFLGRRILISNLHHSFLRFLFDHEFVSFDDIDFLFTSLSQSKHYSYKIQSISLDLLCHFAYEFHTNRIETYEKYASSKIRGYGFQSKDDKKKLKKYAENWENYLAEVKAQRRKDDFCDAIYNDDVETFQLLASRIPNFDNNLKLNPFDFESIEILRKEVTYIQLAAFYGSVRCFQYLLLQDASLLDVPMFAVCGGNTEIIHILEQNQRSFKDLVQTAIEYHHYDIAKYLSAQYGPVVGLYPSEYRKPQCPLVVAIQTYNHQALLSYYDEGIHNRIFGSPSLLSMAIESNNLEAVKLLLTIVDVDVNQRGTGHDTPLIYYAASFHQTEVVKMLVEIGHCELPTTKAKGNAEANPLFVASEFGFEDIVEFLAPFYKNEIDDDYLAKAKNDQIREIELRAKQS